MEISKLSKSISFYLEVERKLSPKATNEIPLTSLVSSESIITHF